MYKSLDAALSQDLLTNPSVDITPCKCSLNPTWSLSTVLWDILGTFCMHNNFKIKKAQVRGLWVPFKDFVSISWSTVVQDGFSGMFWIIALCQCHIVSICTMCWYILLYCMFPVSTSCHITPKHNRSTPMLNSWHSVLLIKCCSFLFSPNIHLHCWL